MYVFVHKATNRVKFINESIIGYSFVLAGIKNVVTVYEESDDTVVSIGHVCHVNGDGSRTYSESRSMLQALTQVFAPKPQATAIVRAQPTAIAPIEAKSFFEKVKEFFLKLFRWRRS